MFGAVCEADGGALVAVAVTVTSSDASVSEVGRGEVVACRAAGGSRGDEMEDFLTAAAVFVFVAPPPVDDAGASNLTSFC